MKENELLKEEVKLLHALLKEALPVFSKITEEIEGEGESLEQYTDQNNKDLLALQQSLSQIKNSFNQTQSLLQNNSNELYEENVDFEASVLDERKNANNRQQNTITTTNMYLSNGNTVATNYHSTNVDQTNNSTLPINSVYRIDKRGKLKDLNKASKNFNLPFNLEQSSSKKDLNDSNKKMNCKRENGVDTTGKGTGQGFTLGNLNIQQIKQLKELIQKINKAAESKEKQIKNNSNAMSTINYQSNKVVNNKQFQESIEETNSRNCQYGFRNSVGEQYFSENIGSGTSFNSEGDELTQQSSILGQVNKPKLLVSQFTNLQSPFYKFQVNQVNENPKFINKSNNNENTKICPQVQNRGPQRKAMNYPLPLVIDQNSQHFECQPSFVTTTSYQSSDSQASPCSDKSNNKEQNKENLSQFEEILNEGDIQINSQIKPFQQQITTTDQFRRDELIEYLCSYEQKPLQMQKLSEQTNFNDILMNNYEGDEYQLFYQQDADTNILRTTSKFEQIAMIIEQQQLLLKQQLFKEDEEEEKDDVKQQFFQNKNIQEEKAQQNQEQKYNDQSLQSFAHQIKEVNFDKLVDQDNFDEQSFIVNSRIDQSRNLPKEEEEEVNYIKQIIVMPLNCQTNNNQQSLSNITGDATFFQDSYDPINSVRCTDDLPKQQEQSKPLQIINQSTPITIIESCNMTESNIQLQLLNPTTNYTNMNERLYSNAQIHQEDEVQSKINHLMNDSQINANNNNLYHDNEMSSQNMILSQSYSINSNNNVSSHIIEDSIPKQEVLQIVQQSHPQISNIRESLIIKNDFNTLSPVNDENSSIIQFFTNNEGSQNKNNKESIKKKRQTQKWSCIKQKETNLVSINQQALKSQRGKSYNSCNSNDINERLKFQGENKKQKDLKHIQRFKKVDPEEQPSNDQQSRIEQSLNQKQSIIVQQEEEFFQNYKNTLGSAEENIISVLDVNLIEVMNNETGLNLENVEVNNSTQILKEIEQESDQNKNLNEVVKREEAQQIIEQEEKCLINQNLDKLAEDKTIEDEEVKEGNNIKNDKELNTLTFFQTNRKNRYHSMAKGLQQNQSCKELEYKKTKVDQNNQIIQCYDEYQLQQNDKNELKLKNLHNQQTVENSQQAISYYQNSNDFKEYPNQQEEIEEDLKQQEMENHHFKFLYNEQLIYKNKRNLQLQLGKNDSDLTLNQVQEGAQSQIAGIESKNSSGRSKLEILLEEFIKDNMFSQKEQSDSQQTPTLDQHEEENNRSEQVSYKEEGGTNSYICNTNLQNIFEVKGLSQNNSTVDLIFNKGEDSSLQLSNQQEKKKIMMNMLLQDEGNNNEFEPLILEVKISPIKMKCNQVENVIKEESSVEDQEEEESRITQQSQKILQTENISFLTLNSQVSLAKLESKISNNMNNSHAHIVDTRYSQKYQQNKEVGAISLGLKNNDMENTQMSQQQCFSLKKEQIKYFIGSNSKVNNHQFIINSQEKQRYEEGEINQSSLLQDQQKQVTTNTTQTMPPYTTPHKETQYKYSASYDNRYPNFTTSNNKLNNNEGMGGCALTSLLKDQIISIETTNDQRTATLCNDEFREIQEQQQYNKNIIMPLLTEEEPNINIKPSQIKYNFNLQPRKVKEQQVSKNLSNQEQQCKLQQLKKQIGTDEKQCNKNSQRTLLQMRERREQSEKKDSSSQRLKKKIEQKINLRENSSTNRKLIDESIQKDLPSLMAIQTARDYPQYTNRTREEVETYTQRDSLQKSTSKARNSSNRKIKISIAQLKKNKFEEEKQLELEQKLKEKEEKIKSLLLKKKEQEEKIRKQRIIKEQQQSQNSISSSSQITNIAFNQLLRSPRNIQNQVMTEQSKDYNISEQKQKDIANTSQIQIESSSSAIIKQRKFSINNGKGTPNTTVLTSRSKQSSSKTVEKGQNKKFIQFSNQKKKNSNSINNSNQLQPSDILRQKYQQDNKFLNAVIGFGGAQTQRNPQQVLDILSPNKVCQPTERQVKFMKKVEEECQQRRHPKKNKTLQLSQVDSKDNIDQYSSRIL